MKTLTCTKQILFHWGTLLIHLSYTNIAKPSISENTLSHIHLYMMDITIPIISLFTGVSVLFNEAKIEQHMLHFKLWKRLLLTRDISVRTIFQHTYNDRHSLSLRLTRIVTERVVFVHRIVASFIICHTQAILGACKIVHLAGTVAFALGSCAAACCQLINVWRGRRSCHQKWN